MPNENITTLKGLWLAKIWIVAPALVMILVAALVGEGDYLVPFMGVLWIFCFTFGQNMRRRAAIGTVRRSAGFHISFWSGILAAVMFLVTAATIADGQWRYERPAWLG
ncbi:hypothetical protein [Novosphingobium sp. B1]|uniref:hypothetical protein n=1 Tax=Novosphingobium sp. B1 TaxID=1938756 RepID=UPI0009D7ED0C|nr:hypothetical protein [Novosphingobium sp. B1]SMC48080.1 hypothetical protein SAMN06272759_103174 [Novosphingobium sp. B1]